MTSCQIELGGESDKYYINQWLFSCDNSLKSSSQYVNIYVYKYFIKIVCVCVYAYIYAHNFSSTDRIWHKIRFKAESNWFELVFFLRDKPQYEGQRV